MTSETAMCLRCGIVNTVRSGTRNYLCESCKFRRDIEPTETDALTGGHWHQDGLIRRWVTA